MNLTTHLEIEPTRVSDAHALVPALESACEKGLAPEEVLADSLYGSDETLERAKEMGVDVVAPTMGTPKEGSLSLVDFPQNEKGKIIACPRGHATGEIQAGEAGALRRCLCLEGLRRLPSS